MTLRDKQAAQVMGAAACFHRNYTGRKFRHIFDQRLPAHRSTNDHSTNNAVASAELTDNAGWELLAELAAQAGEDEFSAACLDALAQEEQHLLVVRTWLAALLSNGQPSVSV